MKAIEILIELKEQEYNTSIPYKRYTEALAELQQLESKSCVGCECQIEVGVGVGSHRPNCIMCSRYYNDNFKKEDK